MSAAGDLTVTHLDGHGTLTLPATYIREHVRLGYAATEPGNQSGTEGASITLATTATTGRGLYVAVTRGHDDNVILTVTETHDIREVRELLEQIVASDRADIPATTVRRQLAQQDRQPPPPRHQARCTVPDWFHTLRRDAAALHAASQAYADYQTDQAQQQTKLDAAQHRLDTANDEYRPFQAEISRCNTSLQHARHEERAAQQDLDNAGFFDRKQARADLRAAHQNVTDAEDLLTRLTERAAPYQRGRAVAAKEFSELRSRHRTQQIFDEWNGVPQRYETAQQRSTTLDGWHHWATGKPVTPDQTLDIIDRLHTLAHRADNGTHIALANVVEQWTHTHGIHRPPPTIKHGIEIESQGIDIGC